MLLSFGSFFIFMQLPEDALEDLRMVLSELGFDDQLATAQPGELEEFALFLLNLTAAAVKTRAMLAAAGRRLPPSELAPTSVPDPVQPALPGFGD